MQNDIFDLKKLNNENAWAIHYACNGLYNGILPAPNVSCIIVCNLSCKDKRKFYVKDYLGENNLEEAEKLLLEKFSDFINENVGKYFVHWNMNSAFGFDAIKARAKEFNIEINDIPDENKIDLSKMAEKLAGKKLSLKQALMFNHILFEDFQDGKDELAAYNKREYEVIFDSVHDKAIGIKMLLESIKDGSFKVCFDVPQKSKFAKEERKQIDIKLKRYREETLACGKASFSVKYLHFKNCENIFGALRLILLKILKFFK